ncbi:uncharacterized protein LOC106715567 [Papilio machaon]|uniref:uncharacterized protein LOC106715567 n=1 Tax=Papilio machaon TaxID=76193 RepID=UPI001E665FB1|nr:uncharacterized protein LOC106715567 [Papilio machaon]
MRVHVYTFALLICCGISTARDGDNDEERSFITAVEETLETRYEQFVFGAAQWLESVNDRRLGSSVLGRLLHYNDIKPKLEGPGPEHGAGVEEGRSLKKAAAAGVMPLVFHVGAASTWMLVTSLLAAKSLALGLLLLVFKIAVSSAKVASFFTAMKGKQSEHHHDWSWSPHHHHGYERSLSAAAGADVAVSHSGWSSHALDWTPDTEYRTLPHEGHEGHGGEPLNADTSLLHT